MDDYNPALRNLHTNLLRIRTVTEELEGCPRQLKRLQQKTAAAEKALSDHLAAIKALKVAIHDREVSVRANAEKIKKHKRDLDSITSKKEFDALNVEVAALQTRNTGLEDETFTMMTRVEELNARSSEFEAAVTKAKEDYARTEAEHQAQSPSLLARLEEAKRFVETKINLLPADFIPTFRRLEHSEGADALAPLSGRSCSSCYTEVTAQQYTMSRSGRISTCKNCGKILYVEE